jgi:hypothetical protein
VTAATTEVFWRTEMLVGDHWRSVVVSAEVTGRYRPATWGYAGGDPPEGPEVTVTGLSVEEGEDEEGRPLPALEVEPDTLDEAVRVGLEDHAAELAEYERARKVYGEEPW